MSREIGHLIAGERVAGSSGRSGPVFDPATGEETGRVAFADASELQRAVDAAKEAQPGWAATAVIRRARVMFKFKELLERHADELARLITAEHGKTLDDARGEITRGLEVVEFACGIPQLLKGEFSHNVGSGVDVLSVRHPVGIAAGITPFNFPVMVPLWMAPMAIACGNAFILKPSEKDPSSSLRMAELALEAGVPAGIFQVVNGDKDAVNAILGHEDIAAVSFVGATATAKYIYETGTRHGKRVQALGGAKNHMIVMP
ncbi:MAG: aldehyde dehydrogenase family protein, partial [Geminicoccaceae bacterium]|nr:aldehyde dehydrogenase family protein [Geminicoccaceae bacterium]